MSGKKTVEILAPAGSVTSLEAGLCAGADAVYIGGSRFGARAFADNPGEEELLRAIDYVHLHGRKIYLTVNTLLKDKELQTLYAYLLPYYRQGIDAVIVQDIGVMRYIKRQFPGLPLHVSTQAAVTGSMGAEFFGKLGAERIVPARELSLSELQDMKRKTGLEIECFVHGAMCYSYSGQCLLSSLIGGRSGNRGQCAQPCRLPYGTEMTGYKDLMSLKDLCAIDLIPELIDVGIDSFKIEGRMKQPEYVYIVVNMYRKYVDLYLEKGKEGYQVEKEDRRLLKEAYQRRGYTEGYYKRHNGKEMISLQRPDIERKDKREGDKGKNYKIKEKINGKLILSEGKRAKLCLEYKGKDRCVSVEVQGAVAEKASKVPLTQENIEQKLRKTGNTEFIFDRLEIMLEGEVFIPIQALNELRRKGISRLEKEILSFCQRENIPKLEKEEKKQKDTGNAFSFGVLVQNKEQFFTAASFSAADVIYVDDEAAFDLEVMKKGKSLQNAGRKIYAVMPYIFRERAVSYYEKVYEDLLSCYDGVLLRNWESYMWLLKKKYPKGMISDCNMYVFNGECKDFMNQAGFEKYTCPAELNGRELLGLSKGAVFIVYGYQAVMIAANCIRSTVSGCDRQEGFTELFDRYQKKFMVKNRCRYCYNIMYNCAPLLMPDMAESIKALGLSGIRLDFTVEKEEEMQGILSLYEKAFLKGEKVRLPDMQYTRGHFKRGVK